ncbi:MAG TPA: hypothetical protein VHB53_05885 [Solirubrobacterales bacterium]|nr:hypothetical protein [Solirubrobacterales bacterium]
MTDRHDLDPNLPAAERERLVALAERLERERPLPGPTFRGELRRRLLAGSRRSIAPAARFRLRAASYAAAGTLCLLVAAIGLAGVGPFAA